MVHRSFRCAATLNKFESEHKNTSLNVSSCLFSIRCVTDCSDSIAGRLLLEPLERGLRGGSSDEAVPPPRDEWLASRRYRGHCKGGHSEKVVWQQTVRNVCVLPLSIALCLLTSSKAELPFTHVDHKMPFCLVQTLSLKFRYYSTVFYQCFCVTHMPNFEHIPIVHPIPIVVTVREDILKKSCVATNNRECMPSPSTPLSIALCLLTCSKAELPVTQDAAGAVDHKTPFCLVQSLSLKFCYYSPEFYQCLCVTHVPIFEHIPIPVLDPISIGKLLSLSIKNCSIEHFPLFIEQARPTTWSPSSTERTNTSF